MKFVKAQRKQAKLRLALAGPSGSGKTTAALLIAKGLAAGPIAVIDTERGSASLYSDLVEFDTLELTPPFHPERFIDAIHAAESGGYGVIVIDSMTHEWDGAGGVLELNETIAQAKFRGNTWAAWNEMTPRHRAFVDAILQSSAHVICTMRSKTETVQGEDKKVRKVGMKTVQRDGTDYEFALVFEIEHEKHYAVATKDRTRLFPQPHKVTAETGAKLKAWLESGAEPAPKPEPAGAQPGGITPDPPGQVDANSMEYHASRLLEYAMTENVAAIKEHWSALKTDEALAQTVWRLLQKESPSGFKYVKDVLRPKDAA